MTHENWSEDETAEAEVEKLELSSQGRQAVGLRAAHHGDDSARRHRALLRQGVQRADAARPHVPGFRPGRAPRKLIETRFRKDVADQVKGSLLMDSLAQITEDQDFSAISEPDFDPLARSSCPTKGR